MSDDSGIFTTTGRIHFYNCWKGNCGKLHENRMMNCDDFHQSLIHFNFDEQPTVGPSFTTLVPASCIPPDSWSFYIRRSSHLLDDVPVPLDARLSSSWPSCDPLSESSSSSESVILTLEKVQKNRQVPVWEGSQGTGFQKGSFSTGSCVRQIRACRPIIRRGQTRESTPFSCGPPSASLWVRTLTHMQRQRKNVPFPALVESSVPYSCFNPKSFIN
jgi:hypothetical protein